MIELQNFEKTIGARVLYTDVNLTIKKQVSAIIGPNGSGKTTLFKCLAGLDKDFHGKVSFDRKNPLIGHMEQEILVEGETSILDFIKNKIGIIQLEEQLNALYIKIGDENEDQDKVMEDLGEVQEQFEMLDGYTIDDKILKTLISLGFEEGDLERKIGTLSGGQKRKVLLASIFLKGVDLILLDEPTNDLDIQSVYNLINYIQSKAMTLLVISHDVNFINAISDNVIEIDPLNHKIEAFNLSYGDFKEMKEKELEKQLDLFEKQQEEKARLKRLLSEEVSGTHKKAPARTDNDKGAYNKARETSEVGAGKRINVIKQKIEGATLEKPIKKKPLRFDLSTSDLSRGDITMKDIKFTYPVTGFEIAIPYFTLSSGKRIVLLGSNGTGKSTLIKLLTGDIEKSEGEIQKNSSFKFGTFNQAHGDLLNSTNTIDYLEKFVLNKDLSKQDMLQSLARFEIKAENTTKDIKLLSPGERARVILSLFNLNKYNTLILDEPTNHLDIDAVEELIRTLNEFEGTLLIVSHDVHFIESINDCEFYCAEEGVIKEIPDFATYLNKFNK